jgi:hypothetical protein
MYAISYDIEPPLAKQLLLITIAVVVVSIVSHDVSVTPLMTWYGRRRYYRGNLRTCRNWKLRIIARARSVQKIQPTSR